MPDIVVGGLLTLAGVVAGLVIELVRDERKYSNDKSAKRWDVEYEALRELGDLLPPLLDVHPLNPDLEERTARMVALAFRVRDDRVRRVIEPLVATHPGSTPFA